MDHLFAYIDENADPYLASLQVLLRQPSVAAQNVGRAETAALVEGMLADVGVEARQVDTRGGFPVVYGEAGGASGTTLRFFNHYDVQPAEPLDLWESDPWGADVRDGRIWARGVADHKGNLAARVAAVDAYRQVRGEPRLNIKFIVEGEEEIGSIRLGTFAVDHPDPIAADACIWEMGGTELEGRPVVPLGMKGISYVELRAVGAKGDQHSAAATVTPNPAWRLVWALVSLKDADERVRIPGCYDSVVPPTADELATLDRMSNQEAQRKEHLGIERFLLDLSGTELFRRDFFEPTCTIFGLLNGYTGEGSKTVLPSRAMAKLDLRLVPDQDPDAIFALLRRYLDDQGYADIEMTLLGPERPGRTPPSARSSASWSTPTGNCSTRSRSSSRRRPVPDPRTSSAPGLGSTAARPGVGHRRSKVHAPNENISVADFVRCIKHICLIMDRIAAA